MCYKFIAASYLVTIYKILMIFITITYLDLINIIQKHKKHKFGKHQSLSRYNNINLIV